MEREPDEGKGTDLGDLISGMGRERMALRARNTTVFLTVVCFFACLGAALVGFTGYVLPRAVGPAKIFLSAALGGLFLSVVVARRAWW